MNDNTIKIELSQAERDLYKAVAEEAQAQADATEDRKRGYVRALVRRLRLNGSWCVAAMTDAILRCAEDRLYFLEPEADDEPEPTDTEWIAFADGIRAGYELATRIVFGGYAPLKNDE